MKQQLTKEQSKRLIELGVPTEKASESVVEENHGENHSWTYPVFTIGDLLEVLPKEIGNAGYMTLGMEVLYDEEKYFWKVLYYDCAGSVFEEDELIDALFDLVVWCIDNRYIKVEML